LIEQGSELGVQRPPAGGPGRLGAGGDEAAHAVQDGERGFADDDAGGVHVLARVAVEVFSRDLRV
jgi:hypothetical protein